MSFGGLYYPAYTPGFGSKPRLQTTHPFRNLVGAGSNLNQQWSGASGHSGYGLESPDYDYHSDHHAYVPSGGSYSYHATADHGYGPPAAPVDHPPAKPALSLAGGGKKGGGKRGSSAMSALTLLSFLFFINLLQGCIKDHMDAMNPTVMVMTTNVIRNRFNKMGEMNSREQSSAYTSNAANIVVQPADLVAAAAAQSHSAMEAAKPSVSLQSPYSNNPTTYSKPSEQAISQSSSQYMHNSPEPEVAINYAKPQQDPHKPDSYEHLPQQQQTLFYDNRTLLARPPPYKLPSPEQHYNSHHNEYYAQPPPQPSFIGIPQYSSSQNPFYEHQHPTAAKPYNGNAFLQSGGIHQNYDFTQKYEIPQQQQNQRYSQTTSTNGGHPWSSHLPVSSVVSGPFRRASITAVAPKTRWITVPARINDHTAHFDTNAEDVEEEIQHHADRDVFHSRFN